jgi:hypothetical protein
VEPDSIPDNPTLPGTTVTVATDLQVNRNLNVNGNITIGGTTAFVDVERLRITDADIVLGYRTDSNNNDASKSWWCRCCINRRVSFN